MRIGFGFDVHQMKDGHPFWLGGIQVPHEKGAFGHSDADVIIHAICDALLGAANLGDIGKHFPDTSAEFKGIDSKLLLDRVCRLIDSKDYRIGNIDVTLCLQKPKIAPHIPEMLKVLTGIMN
ncbi:MAG: 2-C-methyl-D-erythritol 2,4-cyclodiphosphate synthase, partial [Flavobacteriales bacterium]